VIFHKPTGSVRGNPSAVIAAGFAIANATTKGVGCGVVHLDGDVSCGIGEGVASPAIAVWIFEHGLDLVHLAMQCKGRDVVSASSKGAICISVRA